ncbi:MAG: nitronate monooxygenase, partial [Thermodesulfobacteriota bacterium]
MNNEFWPSHTKDFIKLLGIEHPIIQAPMAGGPTTYELVAAVSNAGALGSFGAAYLSPEQINSDIEKVKELTNKPFCINLFTPEQEHATKVNKKVLEKLDEFSKELGVHNTIPPSASAFTFEDQLDVLIHNNVSVFSFTFGVPEQKYFKTLLDRGIKIIGTATCVEEAVLLEKAGCTALVAQGSEAGGHRGTFESTSGLPMIGGLALIPQIVDKVNIPVIASGGVMDGRGIAACLALGASAVQIGTAFLSTKEAGVSQPWLEELKNTKDTSTVLTRSFTGKYARGIKNLFIDKMKDLENDVPPYPIQNRLTRKIRDASKQKGDSSYMSLWAGQGSA